jgi:hypothetical protein
VFVSLPENNLETVRTIGLYGFRMIPGQSALLVNWAAACPSISLQSVFFQLALLGLKAKK